jgi:hypothetical protein
MKVAVVILAALTCLAASAQIQQGTIDLTVNVRVDKADKICAKAIAVLATAKNTENPDPFILIDGKPSTTKCLEVIFSELSSPTNGYTVVAVQSGPGR